jgi:hypothetical protein
MKSVTLIQQYWTGTFNEVVNYQECSVNIDDILSITPREIYVEDLTLASHIKHDSKFLKVLGALVVTKGQNLTVLQSPDEINEVIKQGASSLKLMGSEDLDAYIDKRTRDYVVNERIIAERDKQTRLNERFTKVLKRGLLVVALGYLVFSVVYPQQSYEVLGVMQQTVTNVVESLASVLSRWL